MSCRQQRPGEIPPVRIPDAALAFRPQVRGPGPRDQSVFLDSADGGSVNPASVWIHRFYDDAADTFGNDPEAFSFEEAARDLFRLIRLILQKTGAPKVFLVAHSMGGFIRRSLVQRAIPESMAGEEEKFDPAAGARFVARIFTYATSHGGIRFAVGPGLLERIRDATGIQRQVSSALTACTSTSRHLRSGRYGHETLLLGRKCPTTGFRWTRCSALWGPTRRITTPRGDFRAKR